MLGSCIRSHTTSDCLELLMVHLISLHFRQHCKLDQYVNSRFCYILVMHKVLSRDTVILQSYHFSGNVKFQIFHSFQPKWWPPCMHREIPVFAAVLCNSPTNKLQNTVFFQDISCSLKFPSQFCKLPEICRLLLVFQNFQVNK